VPELRQKLSPEEKVAGRKFRDEQQAYLDRLNETDPPTYDEGVDTLQRYIRHECAKQGGRKALSMQEVYIFSDDKKFGFIFKEGKCRCGETARTATGRFVIASERPPLEGRVARR